MGNENYLEYFEKIRSNELDYIDDKTDNDLELKRILKLVDSTFTTPGRSLLYSWLRYQCLSRQALDKRTTWIKSWENSCRTDIVQKILKKCDHQDRGSVVNEI